VNALSESHLAADGRELIMEVGGTDEGDVNALFRRKVTQALRSPFSTRSTPAACVVRFVEPVALLWVDDGSRWSQQVRDECNPASRTA